MMFSNSHCQAPSLTSEGAFSLDLIKIVDSPEEAVKQIDEFYNKYHLKPNF